MSCRRLIDITALPDYSTIAQTPTVKLIIVKLY